VEGILLDFPSSSLGFSAIITKGASRVFSASGFVSDLSLGKGGRLRWWSVFCQIFQHRAVEVIWLVHPSSDLVCFLVSDLYFGLLAPLRPLSGSLICQVFALDYEVF